MVRRLAAQWFYSRLRMTFPSVFLLLLWWWKCRLSVRVLLFLICRRRWEDGDVNVGLLGFLLAFVFLYAMFLLCVLGFFLCFSGFLFPVLSPFCWFCLFSSFSLSFSPVFFSFSSPSVVLFFVSVGALPVFLFSGLCFWLSLSVFLFSPLLLFYPLLSPARGCLCPAFIRPETAPVVVTAGLLNAL